MRRTCCAEGHERTTAPAKFAVLSNTSMVLPLRLRRVRIARGRSSRCGRRRDRAVLRPAAAALPRAQRPQTADGQPHFPPRVGLRDRSPGGSGAAYARRDAARLRAAARSDAGGDFAQDPLDYASDPEVQPWPYDPRLALALAEGGRREVAAGSKEQTAVLPSTSGRGAGGAASSDRAAPHLGTRGRG